MLKKLGRINRRRMPTYERDAPPGQFVTEKFPILTYGATPRIKLDDWRFRVFGHVAEEITLDWEQFTALPHINLDAEFHCVTQWSKLQNTWEGVAFNEVMKLIKPSPEVTHVMAHCCGGYSTNLALDVITEDDVLFAWAHDGAPLAEAHGGPLRLVVPKRYGWKSAKWVNGLEFMTEDRPGFWEVRGYHMEGDPWKEQRFWDELM